jgi:hypothetical protein
MAFLSPSHTTSSKEIGAFIYKRGMESGFHKALASLSPVLLRRRCTSSVRAEERSVREGQGKFLQLHHSNESEMPDLYQ